MTNRKDGIRVKNIDGLHGLIAHIKPSRADSDVYINTKIDVTELVKYIDKLKAKKKYEKLTYFHAFCIAVGKLFYNRPYLNRFIIGKKFYDRKFINISFVAKREFTDNSEENFSVINIDENDNIFSLSNKISKQVSSVRTSKTNDADNFINKIGKLPKWIKNILVSILRFADNHDLIPTNLTNNSIYHSSIILSNLGSINCGAIYHNLTDFGTNSILMTIGKIKEEPVVIDGKIEIRKI